MGKRMKSQFHGVKIPTACACKRAQLKKIESS